MPPSPSPPNRGWVFLQKRDRFPPIPMRPLMSNPVFLVLSFVFPKNVLGRPIVWCSREALIFANKLLSPPLPFSPTLLPRKGPVCEDSRAPPLVSMFYFPPQRGISISILSEIFFLHCHAIPQMDRLSYPLLSSPFLVTSLSVLLQVRDFPPSLPFLVAVHAFTLSTLATAQRDSLWEPWRQTFLCLGELKAKQTFQWSPPIFLVPLFPIGEAIAGPRGFHVPLLGQASSCGAKFVLRNPFLGLLRPPSGQNSQAIFWFF